MPPANKYEDINLQGAEAYRGCRRPTACYRLFPTIMLFVDRCRILGIRLFSQIMCLLVKSFYIVASLQVRHGVTKTTYSAAWRQSACTGIMPTPLTGRVKCGRRVRACALMLRGFSASLKEWEHCFQSFYFRNKPITQSDREIFDKYWS